MKGRKRAFRRGLRALRKSKGVNGEPKTLARTPAPYNSSSMPEVDQIICGDSIQVLNSGPEAWVDLVFADPPFNIGYLYHGYDDRRKTEDYLQFSHDWMKSVHRALKPTGSFYLAIGDEYAADLWVVARRPLGFGPGRGVG